MLRIVRRGCRSNKGKKLRKLMRIAGKTSIDDLKKVDFNDLIYNEIPEGEKWKIRLAEELIEIKNGIMDVKILTSMRSSKSLRTSLLNILKLIVLNLC